MATLGLLQRSDRNGCILIQCNILKSRRGCENKWMSTVAPAAWVQAFEEGEGDMAAALSSSSAQTPNTSPLTHLAT